MLRHVASNLRWQSPIQQKVLRHCQVPSRCRGKGLAQARYPLNLHLQMLDERAPNLIHIIKIRPVCHQLALEHLGLRLIEAFL